MTLPSSAQKVQDALAAGGFTGAVTMLPDSARSAADAAAAIGCEVSQIVKSLVFAAKASGRTLLVVASGAHRIDEAKLAALAGEPVAKASADLVREQTGFAIGGVPPFGHPARLTTFVDEALLGHATLWAAGGHPHAVFALTPRELLAMTGGQVAQLA